MSTKTSAKVSFTRPIGLRLHFLPAISQQSQIVSSSGRDDALDDDVVPRDVWVVLTCSAQVNEGASGGPNGNGQTTGENSVALANYAAAL